jgi:hypothetical protein
MPGVAQAALLITALIAVAGCGGGTRTTSVGGGGAGPSSAPASTTADRVSAASAESPQQTARDRALGERAVLRLSDFPSGWSAHARRRRARIAPDVETSFAACVGVRPSLLRGHPATRVKSDEFRNAAGASARNSVTYLPSVAVAKERMVLFERIGASPCVKTAITAAVEGALQGSPRTSGVAIGSVSVTRLPFPHYGDKSIALRLTVPVSARGLTVMVYVDIVIARKGRAGTTLLFEAIRSPPSGGIEQRLTAITVSRLGG